MRIAIDAMGGDFGLPPNIEGAIAAVEADSDLQVALVGDETAIHKYLETVGYSGNAFTVVASEGVVRMDEKPTEALRKKPRSSIAVCWQLMASGDAQAVVSAGSTGAVVAAGLRTRLFLKGVKRPGIAVALPTAKGRSVLLDVGANPAARPEHLFQYGVMGSIYAKEMLGVESPQIGLMNIGSEEGKGNELYRLTHQFLANSLLKDSYIGNVEGRGLYQGEADVLVCEGFVGNVVLKVSEGMAEFVLNSVATSVLPELNGEREVAAEALKKLGRKYQYSEFGGAPLLGIDGICVICHGSSDSHSIFNALRYTKTFQNRGINSQIVEQLAKAKEARRASE